MFHFPERLQSSPFNPKTHTGRTTHPLHRCRVCCTAALWMAAPCWGAGGAPLSPPCTWGHMAGHMCEGNASHPALTLVPPSKNTSWRGAKHNSQFLLLPSFPGSHIITELGRESKPGTRRWEPGEISPKMPFPLGEERLGALEPPVLSQAVPSQQDPCLAGRVDL